jgi:aromatic-amino-acid transaminase
VLGQLKATVRRNYSSPGIHAAGIVARVLTDPRCAPVLGADVAAHARAHPGHAAKPARRAVGQVPGRDFGYFLSQRGMFSYTGLSAAQVDRLREEFGVYLIRSGRMCVAGLNTGNVERTAVAMACSVLQVGPVAPGPWRLRCSARRRPPCTRR